ncbi:MAG: hypothetical protein JWN72_2443, partial [Thermoleophilia bacterium]|nr:hypothetical protein [Thermoleophilia bacterium]
MLTEANRVKDTIDTPTTSESAEGTLRGLFRRGRRTQDASPDIHAQVDLGSVAFDTRHDDALETVDDIARRMDLLTAEAIDIDPANVRGSLDLQRAKIARANEASSTPLGTVMPKVPTPAAAPLPHAISMPTQTVAPEAPVTTDTTTTPTAAPATTELPADEAQIQARMDAVLAPTPPVTAPALDAELQPSVAP